MCKQKMQERRREMGMDRDMGGRMGEDRRFRPRIMDPCNMSGDRQEGEEEEE